MNAASELAAKRKITTKPCAVCGAEVVGLATRKTCSDSCRQKLCYQKRKNRL